MSRRQAGFTLLEAVVAMTLLVVVGGALLAWLNSGFFTAGRMADAQRRIEASRTALAYLERLNPMVQGAGQAQLGPYTLEWQSQPLTAPLAVVGRYSGNAGPYDAVLFRVDARVSEKGEAPLQLFVELSGYQQTRSSQDHGADMQ